jgi:hypothetical protein
MAVEYGPDLLKRGNLTLDEAKAVVSDAAKAYRAAEGTHGKATVKAAYAARVAVEAGILVVGKNAKRFDHTEKAADYGRRFENLKGGGVSQSTVNLWVTLGTALTDCGVDEDSDLFRHLAFKGAGQRKEVSEVIREHGTPDEIETVVRQFVNPDGTKVTRKAATTPAEGTGNGTGDGGTGTTPVEPARSDVAIVRGALETIVARVPGLGDEDWIALSDLLLTANKALNARGRKYRNAHKDDAGDLAESA